MAQQPSQDTANDFTRGLTDLVKRLAGTQAPRRAVGGTTTGGANPSQSVPAAFVNPMEGVGELIRGGTDGAPLAVAAPGSAGLALLSQAVSGGFAGAWASFAEAIDDRVAALLTAGANVTLTYDDTAGTLTIAASGAGGGLTQEQIEDFLGTTTLVAGTGVTVTYDDGAGTITIAATGGGGYTDEQARDAAGAMATDSASVTLDYDDGADTLTAAVILEWLQDTVAAMLTGGSHTDLSCTYQDASGTVDLAVTAAAPSVTALNFVIDGAGDPVTTGLKGFVRVPFAWTDIQTATLLADVSTTAVVDIWQDAYANHPPANADSITASAPLTLTAADQTEDGTLTGWTTTGSAGDVLAFHVDSNTNAELLTVVLDLVRA